ncbi:DUF3784 domain-containing protein [Proteiniborus sp. MB09-C3]|nr:DUF3784 domain-containing protein [Proteiniborus sp. MB09-C3]WIV13663.1 DUF3784 domain-containing protein [Proteiniborus sp. MB09-C3]
MLENAWVLTGLIITITFLLLGLIFAIMKEKGVSLIAGYNFKPKGRKENE